MQQTIFLESDCFYHIYNRGNNKETIFHEDKDYERFAHLWDKYMYCLADNYAYCLLPNHFHYMIKVKDFNSVRQLPKLAKFDDHAIKMYISRQLSNLFNAYSKYFNIKYKRVGKLFCERFKRKVLTSDQYFTTLIMYIHINPVRHGLAKDYRDYKYSSYSRHLSDQPTRLKSAEVIKWFGTKKEYEMAHFLTCEVVF